MWSSYELYFVFSGVVALAWDLFYRSVSFRVLTNSISFVVGLVLSLRIYFGDPAVLRVLRNSICLLFGRFGGFGNVV